VFREGVGESSRVQERERSREWKRVQEFKSSRDHENGREFKSSREREITRMEESSRVQEFERSREWKRVQEFKRERETEITRMEEFKRERERDHEFKSSEEQTVNSNWIGRMKCHQFQWYIHSAQPRSNHAPDQDNTDTQRTTDLWDSLPYTWTEATDEFEGLASTP
jgi:hypothetical protein